MAKSLENAKKDSIANKGANNHIPNPQEFARQNAYTAALSQCSQTLLSISHDEASQEIILNQALEPLRKAARSCRAYLFENYQDRHLGLCSKLRAESRTTNSALNLDLGLAQKLVWSATPENIQERLAGDQSVGGPVATIFAGKSDTISLLQFRSIQSMLLLPIHFEDQWWGYVGFDDCQSPREWDSLDRQLLGTAAEMFANTLQRWQANDALSTQYRYQQSLARFSQVLLNNPNRRQDEDRLLTEALEHLRQGLNASRAYVFQNFQDEPDGLYLGIVAEVCAPDVTPHLHPLNQKWAWSSFPLVWRQTLEAGKPFGGPIEQTFAKSPAWIVEFKSQPEPLRSFVTFPICFDDTWWGFIGFDDVVNERQWSQSEVMILGTAAEIVASALQRWQGLRFLERTVRLRTADLVESNQRLRDEVGQRQQAEEKLERQLNAEYLLTALSTRLLQQHNPLEALQETLQDLGRIVNASRVLLVYSSAKESPFDTQGIQWQASGEQPYIDLPGNYAEKAPWISQSLLSGEAVYINDLSELPEDAVQDGELLAEQNVSALAIFPIMVERQLAAVLVCTDFQKEGDMQPDNLRILQLAANLLRIHCDEKQFWLLSNNACLTAPSNSRRSSK